MTHTISRRRFINHSAAAALCIPALAGMRGQNNTSQASGRIGIIGLDTSHSEVFSKIINLSEAPFTDYKVTVAYHPKTNRDVLNLAPSIARNLQNIGIKIVDDLDTLLAESDAILLESIDGGSHYEQALQVFRAGKPVFIDKPLGASLEDARRIIRAASEYTAPFFSSSSLRFDPMVQKVRSGVIGKINGADVYCPATFDPGHMDMAWYAIHGIEMLYAVMGTGCSHVQRTYTPDTDFVTAVWEGGRVATLRGIRNAPSDIAGIAFSEKGTSMLGPFSEKAYQQLVFQILQFFQTRQAPVSPEETFEIFKFMQACDLSRKSNGTRVALNSIK